MSKRGIIKADEEMAKRVIGQHKKINEKEWYDFRNYGVVFRHSGFDEIFEVFKCFNLPNTEITEANEVILARSYHRPVFVEFTPKDLGAMELMKITPRYASRGRLQWTLEE